MMPDEPHPVHRTPETMNLSAFRAQVIATFPHITWSSMGRGEEGTMHARLERGDTTLEVTWSPAPAPWGVFLARADHPLEEVFGEDLAAVRDTVLDMLDELRALIRPAG